MLEAGVASQEGERRIGVEHGVFLGDKVNSSRDDTAAGHGENLLPQRLHLLEIGVPPGVDVESDTILYDIKLSINAAQILHRNGPNKIIHYD